jgi:exonuclease VII small subunit
MENEMMKDYIKVRDEKAAERGWAKKVDGAVYLDNSFENYRVGQQLILKEDGYTIDNEATDKLIEARNKVEQIKQKLRSAENEAFGRSLIGQKVHTNHGEGMVKDYDSVHARVIVSYGETATAMPLSYFK